MLERMQSLPIDHVRQLQSKISFNIEYNQFQTPQKKFMYVFLYRHNMPLIWDL